MEAAWYTTDWKCVKIWKDSNYENIWKKDDCLNKLHKIAQSSSVSTLIILYRVGLSYPGIWDRVKYKS